MPLKQARQGDTFYERVHALPEGAQPVAPGAAHAPNDPYVHGSAVVLALGEATGHMHQIRTGAVLLQDRTVVPPAFYVALEEPATVVHEEHGKIDLPAGYYRFRGQQEYDEAEEMRRVVD